MNIFEKASREALRFATSIGNLSVEDLWKLPLTSRTKPNLDDIAKGIYQHLKTEAHVSFVDTPPKADEMAQLAFDVVKYIIDVKKAERDTAEKAAATKARNQRVLEIIESKENEALASKSIDELRELLKAA